MPSSRELIFGLNDRKNQSSLAIVKKLDFTLLFAKNYLYINNLAPKDLEVWFEKSPPSIKNPTYQYNLLINRSNVIVWIITTAVLFFFLVIFIQSVISLYPFF